MTPHDMESKVMVLTILLLLIVLTATLPATARRSCLLRNRINWEVHSQHLEPLALVRPLL